MLYLPAEDGAKGVKRPRVPRMGSERAVRGRVTRLSCPCSSEPPCFVTVPEGGGVQPCWVQSVTSSAPAATRARPACPQVHSHLPMWGWLGCLLLFPPQELLDWEETQGKEGLLSPASGWDAVATPCPTPGHHPTAPRTAELGTPLHYQTGYQCKIQLWLWEKAWKLCLTLEYLRVDLSVLLP